MHGFLVTCVLATAPLIVSTDKDAKAFLRAGDTLRKSGSGTIVAVVPASTGPVSIEVEGSGNVYLMGPDFSNVTIRAKSGSGTVYWRIFNNGSGPKRPPVLSAGVPAAQVQEAGVVRIVLVMLWLKRTPTLTAETLARVK